MSLDAKAEAWLSEYAQKHPWIREIINRYDLDLSLYDMEDDRQHVGTGGYVVNRSSLIEDVHFLKTFDEFVAQRLPTNLTTVLDVGVGQWNYAPALATFFRKYESGAAITGIDIQPENVSLAKELIKRRNITGLSLATGDIRHWSGTYDVVVNLCPNLIGEDALVYEHGIISPQQFFTSIRGRLSPNGLFVMGLTEPNESVGRIIMGLITPFFNDIRMHENPYTTDKSLYPLHEILTARPKPQE